MVSKLKTQGGSGMSRENTRRSTHLRAAVEMQCLLTTLRLAVLVANERQHAEHIGQNEVYLNALAADMYHS